MGERFCVTGDYSESSWSIIDMNLSYSAALKLKNELDSKPKKNFISYTIRIK